MGDLREATPWDAGEPVRSHYDDQQFVSGDEGNVLGSSLRFTERMEGGIFVNPVTGFGEVLASTQQENPYRSQMTRAEFGLRDYEVYWPYFSHPRRTFQVWVGSGGLPTQRQGVLAWFMFYGDVDRTWYRGESGGILGDKDDPNFKAKNLPLAQRSFPGLIR